MSKGYIVHLKANKKLEDANWNDLYNPFLTQTPKINGSYLKYIDNKKEKFIHHTKIVTVVEFLNEKEQEELKQKFMKARLSQIYCWEIFVDEKRLFEGSLNPYKIQRPYFDNPRVTEGFVNPEIDFFVSWVTKDYKRKIIKPSYLVIGIDPNDK